MAGSDVSTLPSRTKTALADRFGVDARALAALRISLGLLLLVDLLLRARNLVAFYTDRGVLPRALLAERYPTFARISLHALSGEAWLQVLLFVVAGVLALSLAAGYRTRTVAVLSWLLLVSLHARNPYVLNGGDSLLRRLLFWGLFLPLGTRWSVDARLGRTDSRREWVATLASAALLLQVVLVYATNAYYKLSGEIWREGRAILLVFSMEQFTVGLGDVLASHPVLLRPLGHLWLAMVAASPLLLVFTGWRRGAFALAFAGMHLGMLATMMLGIFPLVSVAGVIPFLPSAWWDHIEGRIATPLRRRLDAARWFGAEGRREAARDAAGGSPSSARFGAWPGRLRSSVVAVLLVVVLLWNAAAVGLVAAPDAVEERVDPGEFRWNMFAPSPPTSDAWYVVPAATESGERVDAFQGREVRWRPAEPDRTFPSARWRKYLEDVRWAGDDELHRAFADYLCRRWTANREDDLATLSVYVVEQPTRFDGPEPTDRVELAARNCSTVR